MIAALFVETNGCYFGLPNVDPWDRERDARLYSGPWPVVAHPPCERWGRYWSGGPSAKVRRLKGDDGGCFASALVSVERWGGILEHPEASHAWRAFDIVAPPRSGGWVRAGLHRRGWTCCVEQGHYGHRARKATWLYACGVELPALRWGASEAEARLDEGFHSAEERRRAVKTGACQRLSKLQSAATPPAFRDLLISIAESARALAAPPAAEGDDVIYSYTVYECDRCGAAFEANTSTAEDAAQRTGWRRYTVEDLQQPGAVYAVIPRVACPDCAEALLVADGGAR